MGVHRDSLLRGPAYTAVLVAPLAATLAAIFLIAPTERTMGDVQRILYIHVAVAWCGLLGTLVTACAGLLYLLRRQLAWDHWAQAVSEWTWLCCGLTLVTGSLWAREAWGVWWTWEPRLATMFLLWAINSSYLVVRTSIDDPYRRARLAAVAAILGALDVPLVVMATRWFRGVHPESPQMDPSMAAVLALSVLGFTALSTCLVTRRRGQVAWQRQLDSAELQIQL